MAGYRIIIIPNSVAGRNAHSYQLTVEVPDEENGTCQEHSYCHQRKERRAPRLIRNPRANTTGSPVSQEFGPPSAFPAASDPVRTPPLLFYPPVLHRPRTLDPLS